MKASRLLTALMFAVLVSGIFTFWLSRRVASSMRVDHVPKHMFVAAGKSLAAGELLKPESLQLIDWPAATPLEGAFKRMEDLTGRVVLYPLPKGQPILERQLAAPGAGAGLTAKIPSGMRAISVRSDEVVGVAGFLLPGTHVDVLMTYHAAALPEPRTLTVLQDVIVLAAGQQIQPQADGKPISVNVVTLLLKPEDAEKLVLATSLGSIYFVLRNGADGAVFPSAPMSLGQLAGIGPAAAIEPNAAAAVRTKPGFQVETILGDKRVIKGFQ